MLINTIAFYALVLTSIALASPGSHHRMKDFTLPPPQVRSGLQYICRAGDYNNGTIYGTVSQDRAIGYIRKAKTNKGQSGYPKKLSNKGNVRKFQRML
ncbi:unnamed protein product [Clonostachys rhizophaga]|uniref:Uncharacterized protein n=1 Tax=Clonostachys rhizophaga TaxID=160324 RepID=A0A9N9VU64_9HYPO|nr:unnamed protein product [Clonostachys rhizophaga]